MAEIDAVAIAKVALGLTTFEEWAGEARRYAHHIYYYAELIDDNIDSARDAWAAGQEPYEYVESTGEHFDLDRCDGFYGINSDKEFKKEFPHG